MFGAHGVGYEVYNRKHEVRMRIEKKREEEYRKSRRMVAAMDRIAHGNA
ncbi:hypothetical protein [Bacillus coahuilensis]|nr:hypothetical protein [Bacillus coahuilensis]